MSITVQQPVVIFDLGAVLIDWNPRYLFRRLFSDENDMEYFLREVCSPAWNVQQDAGRPFAQACALLIRQFPDYRSMIQNYYHRWHEMLGGAIDGSVAILRALKLAGFEVHALTNWSAETFPLAQQRFDFLQWFEKIVVSGEEKCVKPDTRIYQILLQRIERAATDCVFIDDSLPNVQSATQLGFAAIHFQSPAQLQQELLHLHPAFSLLSQVAVA